MIIQDIYFREHMKRQMLAMLCFLACIMCAKAQIGYQVSLLNTATGEARANETVTVTVSLSNSAGEIFYSETKQSTTNDFGVLSLTIGNADTFKNVDLTKMPFYIEVTANGVMIGKSQMLSVPVAEVAKQMAPINKSLYIGKWRYKSSDEVDFNEDGTATITTYYPQMNGEIHTETKQYFYKVDGANIYLIGAEEYDSPTLIQKIFKYYNGSLLLDGSTLEVYER